MNFNTAHIDSQAPFAQAMLTLANTYLQIGNYEEALAWCLSLLEKHPHCAGATIVLESIQRSCANKTLVEQARQIMRGKYYESGLKR